MGIARLCVPWPICDQQEPDVQPLHGGQPWRWALQLGDWRLELGDRAGALDAYRQAVRWQPGEAAIRERIERARD